MGLEGHTGAQGYVLGALGSREACEQGRDGSALGPWGGRESAEGREDPGDEVQVLLSLLDIISPLGDSAGASSGGASLGAGWASSLPSGAFVAAVREMFTIERTLTNFPLPEARSPGPSPLLPQAGVQTVQIN